MTPTGAASRRVDAARVLRASREGKPERRKGKGRHTTGDGGGGGGVSVGVGDGSGGGGCSKASPLYHVPQRLDAVQLGLHR